MAIEIAGCIISDDQQRVLLVHDRVRKWWDLPGGYLGQGESPEEAAGRGLREELGIGIALVGRHNALRYAIQHVMHVHHVFDAQIEQRGRYLQPVDYKIDDAQFLRLGSLCVAQPELSPAAAQLRKQIVDGELVIG